MTCVVQLLAAEQRRLPAVADARSLLCLSSGALLNCHRAPLGVLKCLDPSLISRRVDQVEVRTILLWVQDNRGTDVAEPADLLHLSRVFLHCGVIAVMLFQTVYSLPKFVGAKKLAQAFLRVLIG